MTNSLHPALIIGLGGSGIEIVRRFRRRLNEDYPDTPHVRFLGIDTDAQSLEKPQTPRLPDEFFYHAGGFNMSQYVAEKNLDNFPAIRSWWRQYDKLPSLFVTTGAGQRRPIGRLALYVHFDRIKSAIERELKAIFNAESFAQLDPAYRRSVTVYIVASTCGGTGTGMFLDVAFAARQLVPEIVGLATPLVRGLLIMPSVFTGTGQVPSSGSNALAANAYGALTELDYFMNTDNPRTSLELPTKVGSWHVSRDEVPFNGCFLLGNQDADGAVYTSWDVIMERASAHLQIDLASTISATGQSDLTNTETWMWSQPKVRGRQRVFSSLNADTIDLPSARIRMRWTKRFAAGLIARLDAGESKSVAQAAFGALQKEPGFGWLGRIIKGDGHRSYLPKVDQHRSGLLSVDAANPSSASIVDAASNLQSQAARQLERVTVDADCAAATGTMPDEVDGVIRHALSVGSLSDALAVITETRKLLDDAIETMQVRSRKSDTGDWMSTLAESAGRRKGVLESKEAYARRLQAAGGKALEQAELGWERMIGIKVIESLSDLRALPLVKSHLERRRNQLERVRALLGSVAPRIERISEPVNPPGMMSAISDEDIDHAFEDADRQARLEAFARDHLALLLADETPTVEWLAQTVLSVSLSAVSTVAADFVASTDIRVDQIAERLSRLEPLAVFNPEWTALTLGGGVPEPRRMSLVGVPAHMSGRRKEILEALPVQARDTQIEAIGDNDQVLMFTQHHGYPLFALAEMAACRRAFDADPDGKDLRFTLPEPAVRRWTIEPAAAGEASRSFAIALAMGYVERVGTDYVFRELSNGQIEHSLAAGAMDKALARQKARDEFFARGFASKFDGAWPDEIRRIGGNETVRSKILAWIEGERARAAAADYEREFRTDLDAVTEYVKQIS